MILKSDNRQKPHVNPISQFTFSDDFIFSFNRSSCKWDSWEKMGTGSSAAGARNHPLGASVLHLRYSAAFAAVSLWSQARHSNIDTGKVGKLSQDLQEHQT